MKQYLSTITGPDVNNGEGIRLTLWFQGCTHACPGCHNPLTHEFVSDNTRKDFMPLFQDADNLNVKIKSIIEKELSRKDNNGRALYSGITISGGDPLCGDNEGLKELADFIQWFRAKFFEMDIWLYTGFTVEFLKEHKPEIYNNIIKYCDIVVDGPFVLSIRDITLPFRGSSNQRIIKVSDLEFNDGH
jgi:anaerobic ribonucleoside-triphosphate reductase activating protein